MRTIGLARLADIAAMQDQPMVGVLEKALGDAAQQLFLDCKRCFARRQASAVADPEDMRVHGDGWMAKGCIEDNVCGLAANAR